jgi:hypothetical protein
VLREPEAQKLAERLSEPEGVPEALLAMLGTT